MLKYNAATGMMCFASALVSLKKGGKVRRVSWTPPTAYLQIVDGRLMKRCPYEPDVSCSFIGQIYLLAEDWQEAIVPL